MALIPSPVQPAIGPDPLQRIDPSHLQIGGVIGHRMELTARGNLMQLDWERDFLTPFREKKSPAGHYVGLGKTLDGLVHLAYSNRDSELLELKQRIVAEVIAAQDPDGYLGTYAPPDRVAKCWDVHEMVYIVEALLSDWRYFANEAALKAATRVGDYLVTHLTREIIENPSDNVAASFLTFLGLDRALLALYRATADQRYLDCCQELIDLENWDLPIVEGRFGPIEGHAYAYLTRCLAQVELYRLNGNENLLHQTRRVLRYLLEEGGLVITGTSSICECWHSDQTGSGDLGETCATAYLIRLCDSLLRLEGDPAYADLMERSIYNALFAAQSPDGRQLRYYAPFEGERVYWDLDTYCCPGNFRRIIGELPEMIYQTRGGDLVVSLYTESTLETTLAPDLTIKLHQETTYPTNGDVLFHVDPSRPAAFAVELRKPSWCQDFAVTVNGVPFEASAVPSPSNSQSMFLRIEREWQSGDTLRLEMAMPLQLVRGFAKQEGRAAIMAGPMLYSLNPEQNQALADADLKGIVIDGLTSASAESGGTGEVFTGCRVRSSQAPGELTLTEFADPNGKWSYFLVGPEAATIKDPLLKS